MARYVSVCMCLCVYVGSNNDVKETHAYGIVCICVYATVCMRLCVHVGSNNDVKETHAYGMVCMYVCVWLVCVCMLAPIMM